MVYCICYIKFVINGNYEHNFITFEHHIFFIQNQDIVIKPAPAFLDLVSQAESHELFLDSLQESPPIAAFTAQQQRSSQSSRGGSTYRGRGHGSNTGGRGRGRRPPHCQLCRTNGHYASSCPDLASFARKNIVPDKLLLRLSMLNATSAIVLMIGMLTQGIHHT